nr:hypothetical protein [Tanacetum cinerariifolium]
MKKAGAKENVTSSSFVTSTPERVLKDASHNNVVPPVTSALASVNTPVVEPMGDDCRSSGSRPEARALSVTPSQGSSADDFYESQTIDSASALNVYAALRNQHDAAFLDVVNINSAQHVCMIFESRLGHEHEIMTREKFKKFTDSATIIRQRDAKIADLKARLEKSEAEAAEVIELHKLVSNLEATVAIKVGERANFHTENVGLVERVSALESERDGLKNQVVGESQMREEFVSQQVVAEQHIMKCATELDARIADLWRDMDNDLYPHMLTVIAGRRWVVGNGFRLAIYKCACFVECRSALDKVISMAINKGIQQGLEAGIIHGKAGRSLAQVEAYGPKVEGKYVAVVFEFKGVSFPLLDELESLRDSPIALIMFALTLKYDQDRKMLLSDAIHAIRQSAERQGLCPPSSSAPGGTSLGITDYQVFTLVLAGDRGSVDQPLVTQPHDDLFDTSFG